MAPKVEPAWLRYIVLALVFEKTIQHIVVTSALYFNWGAIRSTVAVDPGILSRPQHSRDVTIQRSFASNRQDLGRGFTRNNTDFFFLYSRCSAKIRVRKICFVCASFRLSNDIVTQSLQIENCCAPAGSWGCLPWIAAFCDFVESEGKYTGNPINIR